jgi:hypothetical protein
VIFGVVEGNCVTIPESRENIGRWFHAVERRNGCASEGQAH